MVTRTTFEALSPIQFEYIHTINGGLKTQNVVLEGGLNYTFSSLLEGCKDVAFVNDSAIALTDAKPLSSLFRDHLSVLYPEKIAGTFTLATEVTTLVGEDSKIKLHENNLYIGGAGTVCYFNITPKQGYVQLTVNGKLCCVSDKYPYDVYLTDEELSLSEMHRGLFEIYYFRKNRLTFRNMTKEGARFISYGKDRKLRCVGLELNEAIINTYHFIPTFITETSLQRGVNVSIKEVKYYTKNNEYFSENDLTIKEQKDTSVNLLCEFPLKSITNNSTNLVSLNMAPLKTNFTEIGTFKPTLSSK